MKNLNICENCKFYEKQVDPNNVKNVMGVCHRYPPGVSAIGVPQQALDGKVQLVIQQVAGRPAVYPGDWCGEFSGYTEVIM